LKIPARTRDFVIIYTALFIDLKHPASMQFFSTAGLAGVTATAFSGLYLNPVISYKQPDFSRPGHRCLQVCKK